MDVRLLHLRDRCSVQGFGIDVIHDHLQWHFTSTVLRGQITNETFEKSAKFAKAYSDTGESYSQIHRSSFSAGAISIIAQTRDAAHRDSATVFVPHGEPRQATFDVKDWQV